MFFKRKKQVEEPQAMSTDGRVAEVDVVLNAVERVLGPITAQREREAKFSRMKFYMLMAFVASAIMINFFAEDLHKEFVLKNDYVSVVKISGDIMPDSRTTSPDILIPLMEAAFADPTSKGVILQINSPGGTPVAAGEIHDRLVQLQKQYPEKEVVAVAGDMLTSGAYWVASGAPTIYANKASMVGSIGIIIRTFGFSEIAEKVGVERRVIHAGENKSQLDPYLPLEANEVSTVESQLALIHGQFTDVVRSGRGERIDEDNYPQVYSGSIWTGEESIAVGLIDGNATMAEASMKHFGTTRYRIFAPSTPMFSGIIPSFAKALVDGVGDAATATVSNHATQILAMPR